MTIQHEDLAARNAAHEARNGPCNPQLQCCLNGTYVDGKISSEQIRSLMQGLRGEVGADAPQTTADSESIAAAGTLLQSAAPLRWTQPRKIFVNFMSDLFHEDVPFEFIDQVFAVMALSRRHTFQVLTKRPARMLDYLTGLGKSAKRLDAAARTLGYTLEFEGNSLVSWPIPNVWLGVSVENQAAADERIPLLLQTPAAVRWISAEPLLGAVDLCRVVMPDGDRLGAALYNEGESAGLDWVVVGGEIGPKARPMHPKWAFSLRDQCAQAGVPFLFTQWGEWVPRSACYHTFADGSDCASLDMGATQWPSIRLTERGGNGRDLAQCSGGDDAYMQKVGQKMAGRLLQGVLHDGYPNIVG